MPRSVAVAKFGAWSESFRTFSPHCLGQVVEHQTNVQFGAQKQGPKLVSPKPPQARLVQDKARNSFVVSDAHGLQFGFFPLE